MKKIFDALRRLKTWVESFAEKPGAEWLLFILAFAESSFFPIPPDVLLIAMAVVVPRRAFRYALICTAGSVLGGMFGYFIGQQFFDLIGVKIINFYGVQAHYDKVRELYQTNAFTAIAVAGFTPIPYKVFTIAAGAFNVSFTTLVIASILSRGGRFTLVAALFFFFGARVKTLIDKYFEVLTILFAVLLIGGFIIIRFAF